MLANFFFLDCAQPSCSIILHLLNRSKDQRMPMRRRAQKLNQVENPSLDPVSNPRDCSRPPTHFLNAKKKTILYRYVRDPFRQRSLRNTRFLIPLFVNCAGERSQFALIFHRVALRGALISWRHKQYYTENESESESEGQKGNTRFETVPMTIVCLTNRLIFFNFIWHFRVFSQ